MSFRHNPEKPVITALQALEGCLFLSEKRLIINIMRMAGSPRMMRDSDDEAKIRITPIAQHFIAKILFHCPETFRKFPGFLFHQTSRRIREP